MRSMARSPLCFIYEAIQLLWSCTQNGFPADYLVVGSSISPVMTVAGLEKRRAKPADLATQVN